MRRQIVMTMLVRFGLLVAGLWIIWRVGRLFA